MIRQIIIVNKILSAFNINKLKSTNTVNLHELIMRDNLYYDYYFLVDNKVQNYNVNQLFQLQ